MAIDPDEPIQYVFINMDTREIVADQQTLLEQLRGGGMLRATPVYPYLLMAGGRKHFDFSDVKLTFHRSNKCK